MNYPPYLDNATFVSEVVDEQAQERLQHPSLKFVVRDNENFIDIVLMEITQGAKFGNACIHVPEGEHLYDDPFNERLIRGLVNQMSRWTLEGKPKDNPFTPYPTELDFS